MRPRSIQIFFLGIVLIISLGFSLGIHWGNPEVREWDVAHRELPDMTVAVLSDFHFTEPEDLARLSLIKRQLIASHADIVLLAGDYIGSRSEISRTTIVKALGALVFPTPSFAVLGNHENWDNREAWKDTFKDADIVLLENEVTFFKVGGTEICIRGLGDTYSGHWSETTIPEPCDDRVITLAHDPEGLVNKTGTIESLSFAGHTHCGQIALPLIGAPFVPTKSPREMHCGRYELGHTGITSGGLGTSILPIRFGPNTEPGWELIRIQRLR